MSDPLKKAPCSSLLLASSRMNVETNLQPNVTGEFLLLNQSSNEAEFRLTGTGETRLDFLEPALEQQFEEAIFLFNRHRVD